MWHRNSMPHFMNATITKQKLAHLETDKGNLYFTVCYLDVPVELGGETIIVEEFYQYINPTSVFQSGHGKVYTLFSSANGRVANVKTSTDAKFVLYDGSGKQIYATTPTGQYSPDPVVLRPVFIGSNGVGIVSKWTADVYNISNFPSPVTYEPNNSENFGLLSAPNYINSMTLEINANLLERADAILSDAQIPGDNPYEPGGPSGPGDLPPGTFDDDSDPIPDSPLPTLSAANTGFTRIYNPTLSQVQQLAQYLWTTPDIIETIWNHIKQFFENPMDAIIGFNLVPVPVPDGGTEDFALMFIKTGVMMTVAANQFVDLDCGTLELKRYYGSALDQSPYTKVSCYLPYIGTVNLNTDEVMGTTLQVKYRVDIVSGSCVAKIFVDGNCLYQYSGHCAITIPISSADFSSYVSAAISVGKLAAAAITAGAGAAMAGTVGEVAQQTNQVVTTTQVTNTTRNPSTGRQITTGTTTTVQTRESPADQSSTQASFSGLSPQNVANTVGAIMSSKPHIEHSGSFSGNSGYLGVRRPFVIIERPNMCMPANYQALNGFPSMITMELSTCKGFTRVQQVQLTGLHATNPEQAEILELLKSGVVL